jgi:hypothetical protein
VSSASTKRHDALAGFAAAKPRSQARDRMEQAEGVALLRIYVDPAIERGNVTCCPARQK